MAFDSLTVVGHIITLWSCLGFLIGNQSACPLRVGRLTGTGHSLLLKELSVFGQGEQRTPNSTFPQCVSILIINSVHEVPPFYLDSHFPSTSSAKPFPWIDLVYVGHVGTLLLNYLSRLEFILLCWSISSSAIHFDLISPLLSWCSVPFGMESTSFNSLTNHQDPRPHPHPLNVSQPALCLSVFVHLDWLPLNLATTPIWLPFLWAPVTTSSHLLL